MPAGGASARRPRSKLVDVLHARIPPCRPPLDTRAVPAQVFTLFLVSGTVYYALTEPRALGAAQISALALMAEWVAEAPSLVFKYFFCATVCPCCIPKKEAVNSMSDMVGGAPACHIDMDR